MAQDSSRQPQPTGLLAGAAAAAGILAILLAGCASTREARRAEAMGVRWVAIPGGTFLMGDTFTGTNPDALPVHPVRLAPFRLTATETTVGQFRAFARAARHAFEDPGTAAGDEDAVSNVDWDAAVAFCAWIGGRLPSEQEWEFAAAGGSEKQLYPGTDSADSLAAYARYRGNSVARPGPVGRKRPNRFGLFDMGGNVAEWIGAFYQFYPGEGKDPVFDDPRSTGIRIVRGGSYSMEPDITRTYWRAGTLREVSSPAIGFRCAR